MVYLLEDDVDIREMEIYALKNSGYAVRGFAHSEALYQALEEEVPDLLLLDIMLPGEDGLSVLRTLRETPRTRQLPIMMITAKTAEMDKVRGLDMGADDYLTKPFGILELMSRVRALLRRAGPREVPGEGFAFGGIEMDDRKHKVLVDAQPVELTFKEYELLKVFLQNRGLVLTREQLMEKVWGFDYEGETRTVDMHIKTLRQKLGVQGQAIKTVRHVGYRLGD